jgi:hypothetical protein
MPPFSRGEQGKPTSCPSDVTEVRTVAGHQALPSTLERSPEDAQRAWRKAHDAAVRQYGEGQKADRTAYGALNDSYRKVGHHWERTNRPQDP